MNKEKFIANFSRLLNLRNFEMPGKTSGNRKYCSRTGPFPFQYGVPPWISALLNHSFDIAPNLQLFSDTEINNPCLKRVSLNRATN